MDLALYTHFVHLSQATELEQCRFVVLSFQIFQLINPPEMQIPDYCDCSLNEDWTSGEVQGDPGGMSLGLGEFN